MMSSIRQFGGLTVTDKEIDDARVVPMRLQKFLARAGTASRRGSENLMTAGRVTVNGQVVTELGSKVDPLVDVVAVDGVSVRLADGPVTIALHKPVGFVTTMSDPHGRPTVAHLVPIKQYPGLFPVGRLDADTTGLLLFSTDGELGNGLLHPRHHVSKRYYACVEGVPTEKELSRLRRGIKLEDGMTAPAQVELVKGASASRTAQMLIDNYANETSSSDWNCLLSQKQNTPHSLVRIILKEGRKRQVKRMFAAIDHPVVALHRDSFGPITLGDIPVGQWRKLNSEEVAALQAAVHV